MFDIPNATLRPTESRSFTLTIIIGPSESMTMPLIVSPGAGLSPVTTTFDSLFRLLSPKSFVALFSGMRIGTSISLRKSSVFSSHLTGCSSTASPSPIALTWAALLRTSATSILTSYFSFSITIQPTSGRKVLVSESCDRPTIPARNSNALTPIKFPKSSSICWITGTLVNRGGSTCPYAIARGSSPLVSNGMNFRNHPSNLVPFLSTKPHPPSLSRWKSLGRPLIAIFHQKSRLGFPSDADTNSASIGSSLSVHAFTPYLPSCFVFSRNSFQSSGVPSRVIRGIPQLLSISTYSKYGLTASISVICDTIRSTIPVVEKLQVISSARPPFVSLSIRAANCSTFWAVGVSGLVLIISVSFPSCLTR